MRETAAPPLVPFRGRSTRHPRRPLYLSLPCVSGHKPGGGLAHGRCDDRGGAAALWRLWAWHAQQGGWVVAVEAHRLFGVGLKDPPPPPPIQPSPPAHAHTTTPPRINSWVAWPNKQEGLLQDPSCLPAPTPAAAAVPRPVHASHATHAPTCPLPFVPDRQLDGEVVVLDGLAYQQGPTGAVRLVAREEKASRGLGSINQLHLKSTGSQQGSHGTGLAQLAAPASSFRHSRSMPVAAHHMRACLTLLPSLPCTRRPSPRRRPS